MLPGRIAHHHFHIYLFLGKFLLCITDWSRTSHGELVHRVREPSLSSQELELKVDLHIQPHCRFVLPTDSFTYFPRLPLSAEPMLFADWSPTQLIRRLCDIIVLQLKKKLDL